MSKKKENKEYGKRLLLVVLGLIVLDQATKFFIRSRFDVHESLPVIQNVFNITHVTNTGSAFGIFQEFNSALIFLSFIALGLIIYCWDRITEKHEKLFFSFIVAGILGNLIDRLLFGHVTDFLNFAFWPAFNVADAAISVGVLCLIFYSWRD